MSNGDWEKRLTELEVRFDERWNAHDSKSQEQWNHIRTSLDEIKKTIDNKPCVDHMTKVQSHDLQLKAIWWVVGIVLATSLTIITTGAWKLIKAVL